MQACLKTVSHCKCCCHCKHHAKYICHDALLGSPHQAFSDLGSRAFRSWCHTAAQSVGCCSLILGWCLSVSVDHACCIVNNQRTLPQQMSAWVTEGALLRLAGVQVLVHEYMYQSIVCIYQKKYNPAALSVASHICVRCTVMHCLLRLRYHHNEQGCLQAVPDVPVENAISERLWLNYSFFVRPLSANNQTPILQQRSCTEAGHLHRY